MNLNKAIEIKLQWRKDNYPPPLADQMDADMMSIEALKAIDKLRDYEHHVYPTPLPGETPETDPPQRFTPSVLTK